MSNETEQPEESLLSKLQRTIVMQVATGGLANGLDTVMANAHGVDVTGLHGANMTDGSAFHHGPGDAGEALDRPSAGYMAHASTHEGVALDQQGENISHVAREINDAGTFSMDGQSIQVLDYMPGGDMVQMAAGQADPGQMLMKIAEHAIAQETEKAGANALGLGRGQSHGSTAGTPSHDHEVSHRGTTPGQTVQDAGAHQNDGSAVGGSTAESSGQHADRTSQHGSDGPAKHANGQHIPDADENARDLERLSFEHHLDLDTAIQSSDHAHVHTEIHAHGRTLEIDTDFDATKPNNDEERAEASEHVAEISRGGHDEVNLDEPGMHMRSRIAAHLDAASRDEGISM